MGLTLEVKSSLNPNSSVGAGTRILPDEKGNGGKMPMKKGNVQYRTAAAILAVLIGCTVVQDVRAQPAPKGTVFVKPAKGARPAQALTIASTPYFSYALPQGWRVGESGQFALTLVAPDSRALTVMAGNAGMPPNTSPGQFAYQNLSAMRVQNLQLGQPHQVQPISGFQHAVAFEVRYSVNGVPCLGVAIVHIAPSYGASVIAMTAALSQASQWPGYSTWLPQVSQQVAATNGAAFGARGIMQQNLQNSVAYGEAAAKYRDWSQKNWQGVTDQRSASVDRQNTQFRENLGAVQTYVNPYDTRTPVELPTNYQYYWVNPQGNFAGTNDPSVNPNVGSTVEWKKVPVRRP